MSENVVPKHFERETRNKLYEYIGRQTLRIAYECSDNPYGDLPEAETVSPFSSVLSDPKFRLRPIHWYSRHWYTLNDELEAAVLYEQRQKGTGYYTRVRAVKELDTEVLVTDYAIKTDAPGRSINWIDMWFLKENGQLQLRDDRRELTHTERVYEIVKSMSLVGIDIEPGHFNPLTPEDYEKAKMRLLKIATIVSKLSPASHVIDVHAYPASIKKYIALPYTYSLLGPRIDQLSSA